MSANGTAYGHLSELCWYIQTAARNDSTNRTASLRPGDRQADSSPSFMDSLLLEGLNYTAALNMTLDDILNEFELFAEWYVITALAAVGIAANVMTAAMLGHDGAMKPLSRLLQVIMLLAEVAYLGSVIVLIQFRHFLRSDFPRRVEWVTIVTIAIGVSQFAAVWLLYLVATDSYRAVRVYQKPSKTRQIARAKTNTVLVLLAALLYYVPFVPDIRVLLYELDPNGFNPCTIPIQEHWDFKEPSAEHDLYYVLYYSLLYGLLSFWIPFLLIAARDKDIIDLLHSVMDYAIFKKPEVINACYTAKVVAIFCNVNMFCMSPKLVLLLFQMTNYAVNFIGEAQIFFEFFNVMANLLLVLKSALYLPLFIVFQPRIKTIMCDICCRKCGSCPRSRVRVQTDEDIPMVIITDA